MCRYASRVFVCTCLLLFASSFASGQITNVTNDQSTPIPGAGHDYVHMLTETVNPANGSVSLRIQVPVPKGRRLTLPFAFAYDSNGVHHLVGGAPGVVSWMSNAGYLSEGGWAYAVPMISEAAETRTWQEPGQPTYSCTFYTDYVFQDPSAGRHALGLAVVQNPSSTGCQMVQPQPYSVLQGGDHFYSATVSANTIPLTIADQDGTAYYFSNPRAHGGSPTGPFSFSLPDYVEDRNGNKFTVTDSGNGAFSFTDTAGRPAFSSSGFGASGNTVTVSGLNQPYNLTWGTASSSFGVGSTTSTDPNCPSVLPNEGDSEPVITTLTLPNGEAYQFQYEGTYGLLSKIIYPTGGYVRYVWGMIGQSEFGAFTDSNGLAEGCQYYYGVPAITDRYVSYDGSTEALHQHFQYSPTTWSQGQPGTWTQKQTTVTTYDLLRGGSFQTIYTYSPVNISLPPNEFSHFASQVPVEATIAHYDWNGSLLATVTKTWQDQYLMTDEKNTWSSGQIAETKYTYGPGAQLTDKYEYDYGGALLRHTHINYASFPATPIYPSTPSIFDRPSNMIIYDGGGNRVAETDYGYDQTAVSGLSGITGHDDANYGASYNNRGNATTKTEWLNTGGASPITTYAYDETGQMLSMTDPCGNATCSDMSGNSHTTSYSYADNYPSGPLPPGPTNAYLTQIAYPNTGVAHVVKFAYNYADGQLTSSTDQNNQTTSYFYSDSLDRLTGINYPDCVQAGACNSTTHSVAYIYNDTPPSPTVTTEKLLSAGQYETSESIMDGAGHITRTELTSDPSGTDYTDTSYDGEGRVWKQSNPYRSTGDPSYGLTTTAYDALGRVTSVTHPDSNITSASYAGNCSTSTDEQSKARKSCTDGLGRLTQVFEDPGGLNYETDYQYDTLDNLTHATEGSQTRIFVYDSLSRELSAANPESGTTTYTYDANANMQTRTRPAANQTNPSVTTTTTYLYDVLNRPILKSYSDGTTPTVGLYYDEAFTIGGVPMVNTTGRQSHTWNGQANTTYSYDPMGRVKDFWQCTPLNCASTLWHAQYTYDFAGDVTIWTHPAGFTITNSINNAQQITQMQSSLVDSTHPQDLAQNITYTPWGAEQTLEDGCAGSCTNTQETYVYNNRMQPVRIELGTPSNAAANYCLVYNYYASVGNASTCTTPAQGTGDNGNVMGVFDQDNSNTSLSHAEAYTYDNLNRLTNAVATGNSTYDLPFSYTADGSDGRYGNVTCVINGSTSGLCPTYNFNPANNQITNSGYTYDAAGNLTSDGVNSYQYDAEGRLRSAGLGGSTVSVVYNALGQTVERSSTGGVAYRQENLYDPEGRELANYDGADGYWWGRNVTLGNRNIALYFSNYVRFVHANNVGTTTAVTDQTGSLLQDQLYYPWGQQWTTAGSPQDLHFASLEQLEPDLGMYPTPHRRYTPTLGRWLTPDPGGVKAVDLADPQTWNMYAYARNNPTTRTDPTGLYTAGCNEDVKKCDKQINNFNKAVLSALKSKNADIRAAAAAYGKLGEKNGVNVTLANVVDSKHSNVAGQTSNEVGTGGISYDSKTNTFQQATQVTIRAGMNGTDLEETAIHEGAHVENRAAFVSSIGFDPATGHVFFNTALNITARQSEINAYGIENAFRGSMGLPRLNVEEILSQSPYSDNPNINNPLFPLLQGLP